MSALILHLETSTKICSVALSQNGQLLCYIDKVGAGFIHGEELTTMIQELLDNAHVKLQDLSAISYSAGPGSYTGLRIGLSTAKGLCFALSLPLIALPTHQILFQIAAETDLNNDPTVVALIDARRTEVYMETYDATGKSSKKLHCALLENTEISTLLPLVVVGDANEKAKAFWLAEPILWIDEALSAKFQAKIAFQAFEKEAFEDLAYCSPIYLKGANGVLL
jgi:tRNA threonylcarbamoyladenosine biosynthesis protein TsaB